MLFLLTRRSFTIISKNKDLSVPRSHVVTVPIQPTETGVLWKLSGVLGPSEETAKCGSNCPGSQTVEPGLEQVTPGDRATAHLQPQTRAQTPGCHLVFSATDTHRVPSLVEDVHPAPPSRPPIPPRLRVGTCHRLAVSLPLLQKVHLSLSEPLWSEL